MVCIGLASTDSNSVKDMILLFSNTWSHGILIKDHLNLIRCIFQYLIIDEIMSNITFCIFGTNR